MSSLTDIIFLLLIFFMLTSTLINIQVDIPESDVKTVAPTSVVVTIFKNGEYTLNGRELSPRSLPGAIRTEVEKAENREEATVTIVAEKGVPFERVVDMMNIAKSLRTRAILATQPRKQ